MVLVLLLFHDDDYDRDSDRNSNNSAMHPAASAASDDPPTTMPTSTPIVMACASTGFWAVTGTWLSSLASSFGVRSLLDMVTSQAHLESPAFSSSFPPFFLRNFFKRLPRTWLPERKCYGPLSCRADFECEGTGDEEDGAGDDRRLAG